MGMSPLYSTPVSMVMPSPLFVTMVSRSRTGWAKTGSMEKSISRTTAMPFICS